MDRSGSADNQSIYSENFHPTATSPISTEPPPPQPKVYAFLFSIQQMIANWKIPGSENKYVRHWMDKANEKITDRKSQRRIVLIVVCIALLLDNMLYMVIVPIIPTYLRDNGAFKGTKIYEYVTVTMNRSNISRIPSTSMTPMTMPSAAVDTAMTTTANQEISDDNNTLYRTIKMFGGVYYKNEEINVGVLFACKAIFQLLVNPFTGTLMDRIGYDIPMMIGLSIIFVSTFTFAIGKSYGMLFVARSMQGVGSAFADTSGMAMIADRYKEDRERSRALGIALAFISFGCLVAPPFGGFFYQFAGKPVPFIILSLLALGDGGLMLFAMKPVRKQRKKLKQDHKLPKGTPIYKLIIDPYIAVCAGCLVMANVSLAFIEPTIALWMKDTMGAPEWQIGVIWLPAFIPHVLGVFVTVKLAERYPHHQWLMAAVGLAMEGISCMAIPFCKSFALLMIPLSTLCFGIALVDTAILPLMGHLVDVRHVSVYGSCYAIADISYSLAYAFGPIMAGQIVNSIGFLALNAGICVSNVLYAPLLAVLRKVYSYDKYINDEDYVEGGLQADGITPNHKIYRAYAAGSDEDDGSASDMAVEVDNDMEPSETTHLRASQPHPHLRPVPARRLSIDPRSESEEESDATEDSSYTGSPAIHRRHDY